MNESLEIEMARCEQLELEITELKYKYQNALKDLIDASDKISRLQSLIKTKDKAIEKCLKHHELVAGPSAFELSGMRVLLEKALNLGVEK